MKYAQVLSLKNPILRYSYLNLLFELIVNLFFFLSSKKLTLSLESVRWHLLSPFYWPFLFVHLQKQALSYRWFFSPFDLLKFAQCYFLLFSSSLATVFMIANRCCQSISSLFPRCWSSETHSSIEICFYIIQTILILSCILHSYYRNWWHLLGE